MPWRLNLSIAFCNNKRSSSTFLTSLRIIDSIHTFPPQRRSFTRMAAATSRKRAASSIITDDSGSTAEQQEHQQREKRARLPRTCEWILQEPAYRAWKKNKIRAPDSTTSSSILQICGPPGSGKSYLAQFITDDLKGDEEGNNMVLSYFCDADSTPASMMRSFLVQLGNHPNAREYLDDRVFRAVSGWSRSGARPLASDDYRLEELFVDVLKQASSWTFVIDGWDELPGKYRTPEALDLPSPIHELLAGRDSSNRLLVTGQEDYSGSHEGFQHSQVIQITADKVRDDLSVFVVSELDRHGLLGMLMDTAAETLVKRSNGIFLWAALTVRMLALQPTDEDRHDTLESGPDSLTDLYGELLLYKFNDVERATRDTILRWLLLAVRPLRTEEIANALSVELNVFVHDFENKAIDVSGSLATVQTNQLKPIHHSLRDFLKSDAHPALQCLGSVGSPEGNLVIAKTLLSYLTHAAFENTPKTVSEDMFDTLYPLAEYATLYWVFHATASPPDADLRERIRAFFNSPTASNWIMALIPRMIERSILPIPPRPPHTALFFHIFTLKSQIVNCFEDHEKPHIDQHISHLIRAAFENTLDTTRERHGPESLPTVHALLDLAQVYSWLPREFQTRVPELLQSAISISLNDNDNENPSDEARNCAIAALQALADDHKRNAKYEDAQRLLEKLLELAAATTTTTTTRADDVDGDMRIMFALDSLGWVCMRRNQPGAAATHLQKALDLCTQRYGTGSPMTLRSKVTLAEVLGKLNRHDESEALCADLKRQLDRHRDSGIPVPRDSISHLNSLAAIYLQQGKFLDAVSTYTVVVDDRRHIFGARHRLTLWAEMQMGVAYQMAGDEGAARRVFEGLVGRQEEVLGGEHPDVKDVKERIREIS